VLVAAGAAAVAIALAGRVTAAEAAGPDAIPAQLASPAGLLPVKGLPALDSPQPVRDTTRRVVSRVVRPLVAQLTAAAIRVTGDPTAASALGTATGALLPGADARPGGPSGSAGAAAGRHLVGPPAGPARPAFGALLTSHRAIDPWPVRGHGHVAVIPEPVGLGLPGLPTAVVSAMTSAVTPAGVASIVGQGSWTPSLKAHHPARSPASIKQTDLASLLERPG
jgi:hypothetical protein